jgi:hypothetical protein
MSAIHYEHAAYPVRGELPRAHERAWGRLARAGDHWSGAERVAIAAEVRAAKACGLCGARLGSRVPLSVSGAHDGVTSLPAAAIEAAHRITSDPGRLSRAWFEKLGAEGLSDERYVELLSVVVTVVSIDAFCRGIGVPPHPLPAPEPGAPSGARPAAAVLERAWVPMIPNGRARGELADLYAPAGRTGNVIRAMSLCPDAVRQLKELSAAHYLGVQEMMNLQASRALDRRQIELVAGRVSALRECFY